MFLGLMYFKALNNYLEYMIAILTLLTHGGVIMKRARNKIREELFVNAVAYCFPW